MDGSSKLPIDIHVNKLLNWIVDRRQCPKDWQKLVIPVRNKISLAIQDMPEHNEITELLTGSAIHYFNCLRIIEILRETEKESKNIFGMYSSQRMKDWNSVINMYKGQNIYLGEAASVLQRSVSFEIPAIKKNILKLQQMQQECDEKYQSCNKSINEINQQLKQSYEELGITGANLARELKEIPNSLDQVFHQIVVKCKNLSIALDYYQKYVEYFFKRKSSETLTCLNYLINHGNKSVYEWRTGLEPKSIEKQVLTYDFGEEKEQEDEGKNDEANNNEINFDFDDVVLDETGDIDWGDDAYDQVEALDESKEKDDEAFRGYIIVEDSGVYVPCDGVAKGNDAYTLLEFKDSRDLILQELLRLQSFLRQKYAEMTDEQSLLMSTILQETPKDLQSFTEKHLKSSLEAINDVLSYFTSKIVERLLLIHDSSKYLKRVYEQLVKKKKSIERYGHMKEDLCENKKRYQREESETNEKLKIQIKKIKDLQKYIAEDLSKKYNGVRVNIMGEINML